MRPIHAPLSATHALQDFGMHNDAANQLARIEGNYAALLETAPDAMVVVNQGAEIVLLNRQAEAQFGNHRDELLGHNVMDITPKGFSERLVADDLRSAEDALRSRLVTASSYWARKDGSEFPIEIMLSPLEGADAVYDAASRAVPAARPMATTISWPRGRAAEGGSSR